MIRLDQIGLREIRLPPREPFCISSGVLADRRIALLELRDASSIAIHDFCLAQKVPVWCGGMTVRAVTLRAATTMA